MKGTYEHNVDAKGRLFIPTKLRDELGDNFVMTKGLDGCLSLYSQKNWAIMEEKIASLPSSKARSLQRYFFSNAMDCEPDSQGRVVIPQVLPLKLHCQAVLDSSNQLTTRLREVALEADCFGSQSLPR